MFKAKVDQRSLDQLLGNLAALEKGARQKLEAKAIRQALGPLLRGARRTWKAQAAKGTSDGRTRKAIARALTLHVDRYRTGGRRERFGKVYVSYKNKYGRARLAHLMENPRGNYRTAGPTSSKRRGRVGRRTYDNRAYGKMVAWRLHTKLFARYVPIMRDAFAIAVREFLAKHSAKNIRGIIKGKYG